MRQHALSWIACMAIFYSSFGQDASEFSLDIKKTDEKITLDGVLDEEIWSQSQIAGDFMLNFPNDTLPPTVQTDVMMTYDDKNLYISAILYEDGCQEEFVVSSLRRDFQFDQNDLFVVYIDPFDDGTNGFTFNVTPFNVQREGLVFNGQRVNQDWDNVWYSEAKIYEDKWVIEMSVPFKTLRFKDGVETWKFNFGRNDLKRNEMSSWVPVPINFWISSLAYTGDANFEKPLKRNGPNISVIPYLASGVNQDNENNEPTEFDIDAGFDAKLAVTSSLNLDVTVNPDFSQVEVDRQQTNLNRFELFFPERRQFFLENSDLFSEFGFERVRPFFSRRIGIGQDTAGNNVQTRIIGGARLSGKINNDWRVGFLNMQTQAAQNDGINANNYTVATVQRQLFSRSNLSAIFVNRQITGNGPIEGLVEPDDEEADYNRVVGLDYNLASADNTWRGKFFYHTSFSPDNNNKTDAHGTEIQYSTREWQITLGHAYVGENYNSEVGFTPRRDYYRTEPEIEYSFYPESKKLVSHGPSIATEIITDSDFNSTDQRFRFRYNFNFKNTARLRLVYFNQFIQLRDSFDPTQSDGLELQEGEGFRVDRYGFLWDSDRRKLFSYDGAVFYGGFFNGTRLFVRTNLNYRVQPFGSLSMAFQYNKVDLPRPYNSADLFLIGPRVDISFTDKLFLTSFIQYNNQIDNINVNTRFQWRFKPVSDLFIVYTDNYLPENLTSKSRAIVFKISYWLNL